MRKRRLKYFEQAPAIRVQAPILCFALLAALDIAKASPQSALWTTPAILISAMLIAWAAESSQFFIAQGFALAILAWLQTLPEFAVEAVLAWKQQVPLLMANLTGALRLLTGLAWPMIYAVAAFFYRREQGKPLRRIRLEREHSVNVIGLMVALAYVTVIYAKGSLGLVDAAILILIYIAYLFVLGKLPPEAPEAVEELEAIPRYIVTSPPGRRWSLILGLFVVGGLIIYFTAEPFLGSLLAVSGLMGISNFVFVQWVAPFVSEFPEKVSAFYWARKVDRADMALMNMVSSNINQWTLLTAMLPMVYSASLGEPTAIVFDDQQKLELLMTLGQALIGLLFLMNMELAWWEASMLFLLWGIQFAFSPFPENTRGILGFISKHIHQWVTIAYFVWSGIELVRILTGFRSRLAIQQFSAIWREHVMKSRMKTSPQ